MSLYLNAAFQQLFCLNNSNFDLRVVGLKNFLREHELPAHLLPAPMIVLVH